MKKLSVFLIILLIISAVQINAQKKNTDNDTTKAKKELFDAGTFAGLKWRSIGPAVMSGRISDFAVNPQNHSEYYVAVSSGHVWKTVNAGTTWEPIFDNNGVYAIGCVTMDPNNTNCIWIGTGENNHQRALGYGNGVYKSIDGGKSFKNMGLKDSRQIGKIVIDPRNSNIVFVAAEGSVWGPGGERGLYKSIDGGKSWKKTLNISENTGVNNIIYDPRDPNVMYATSEQRRRHVHTKIGGGPESAVYKSYDGGETWDKIMDGLPKVDIGGMGIDISPVNPDVIYLIMEAAENMGGFFRSTNRGATWEKMSSHNESGQYYNEIFCDPKNVDKVYSVETVSQVTTDAGKTWNALGNNSRHVDDHAMWIDPSDTEHFLIGGDGGIYESFDGGKTYDFKENLPITQFYRVAVDNSFPFYYVYGGTQDNNSLGGPSGSTRSGVYNSDWFVTNGGDGFWAAIDPENPNIVYAESQYGGMVRYDKASGESISIRPEPRKGELTYKWNWNTPLFISPHKNTRLYTAANKVFRSDDRGDSWDVISDDLTAQLDRNTWPVMGKYWSVDAVAKDKSTSLYGEIVSLTESPVKENLLYAGTDDGLIQISEDAKTWRKVSEFPGVPANTYVSDICASKFDENIVFASFDNILRDDFKPYLLKSTDKGKTWKSIAGNLPANETIHCVEQDFENPNLLFVCTEFSFYFTIDGGEKWFALKSGLPSIAVRDIALQKRESDIVIATFGRGFYILDNYSPLRTASKDVFEKESHMFPIKKALMYISTGGEAESGSTRYRAPNPDFGATFTYYIKDVPKSLKSIRKEKEKALFKDGKPIPQPSDAELNAEQNETAPYLIFTITDESGNIVRKITKSASKGIQRENWDLRYQAFTPVSLTGNKFTPVQSGGRGGRFGGAGTLVMPGTYNVSLTMVSREGVKELIPPTSFECEVLRNTTLPAKDRGELVAFQKKAANLAQTVQASQRFLNDMITRVENLKQSIANSTNSSLEMMKKADAISDKLEDLQLKFNRPSTRPSAEENPPAHVTLNDRVSEMAFTHFRSTSGLTQNEIRSYDVLMEEFPPVLEQLKKIFNEDIKALETELDKINAPWTPGRIPELKK
ncbi:MAG: glycosyl hydrolase [Ignavibacteriae bacterium HGW-Ignavibacteriae-3]|nr:MAG: glycosyl hydrolase [Ignavibacteriae bacterium HGW-Ignavibacteriae-3]